MIEFEEPEKGYLFQGSNLTQARPKVRLTVLFLSFLALIGFLVKNDFDFNFSKNEQPSLSFDCSKEVTFDQNKTKEDNHRRINKALANNGALLEEVEGFGESYVSFEKFKGMDMVRPVVNLTFWTETEFEIPTRMCGFEVRTFYK